MNIVSKNKVRIFALVLLVVFAVLLYIIGQHQQTDIYWHADYLKNCINRKVIPDATLFYLPVALITIFSTHVKTIILGIAVVLGLSMAFRFLISLEILNKYRESADRDDLVSMLVVVGLGTLFCFHLPTEKYWFNSQMAANLWHNSTYLFMTPFALLLFSKAVDFLDSEEGKGLIPLSVLCVLNVFAKPSFFFCFAPVFPLFVLARSKSLRLFFRSIIPVVFGMLALGAYYYLVFVTTQSSSSEEYGIGIGWLTIWSHHTNNIPLSILNSVLIPILYMVLYPGKFFKDRNILFSLFLLLLGMSVYAVFQETGPRKFDGNFWWQLPICNYILHLTVISRFLADKADKKDEKLNARDFPLIIAFVAGVISGVLYLYNITMTGTYY